RARRSSRGLREWGLHRARQSGLGEDAAERVEKILVLNLQGECGPLHQPADLSGEMDVIDWPEALPVGERHLRQLLEDGIHLVRVGGCEKRRNGTSEEGTVDLPVEAAFTLRNLHECGTEHLAELHEELGGPRRRENPHLVFDSVDRLPLRIELAHQLPPTKDSICPVSKIHSRVPASRAYSTLGGRAIHALSATCRDRPELSLIMRGNTPSLACRSSCALSESKALVMLVCVSRTVTRAVALFVFDLATCPSAPTCLVHKSSSYSTDTKESGAKPSRTTGPKTTVT